MPQNNIFGKPGTEKITKQLQRELNKYRKTLAVDEYQKGYRKTLAVDEYQKEYKKTLAVDEYQNGFKSSTAQQMHNYCTTNA